MNKKEIKQSFISMLSELIGDSTMHGLPRIVKSKSYIIKIIWALFTFASVYYCVRQMISITLDYLEYDTVTLFSKNSEIPSPFPAITICNLNPFQTQFSMNLPSILSLIDANMTDLEKRKYFLNVFSEKDKKQFAYNITEILISCTFNTQVCSENDFELYFHLLNGACYRFNNHLPPRNVTVSGYAFGLRLELFVGNEDEMPSFLQNSGYQIMIGNQTYLPTPSEGYLLSPGSETALEVSRTFSAKLGETYSKCLHESKLGSLDPAIYKAIKHSNQTYRQIDCFSLVAQKIVIDRCGCFTPLVNSLDSSVQCKSPEQIRCASESEVLSFSKLSEFCPFECNTQSFDTVISSSAYPIRSYAMKLMKNPTVNSKFPAGESISVEQIKSSVLAVTVYYKDLSYMMLSEQAKNQINDLISSVGGILGLYVGVSLLSLIELLDIFWQSMSFLLCHAYHQNNGDRQVHNLNT